MVVNIDRLVADRHPGKRQLTEGTKSAMSKLKRAIKPGRTTSNTEINPQTLVYLDKSKKKLQNNILTKNFSKRKGKKKDSPKEIKKKQQRETVQNLANRFKKEKVTVWNI